MEKTHSCGIIALLIFLKIIIYYLYRGYKWVGKRKY